MLLYLVLSWLLFLESYRTKESEMCRTLILVLGSRAVITSFTFNTHQPDSLGSLD